MRKAKLIKQKDPQTDQQEKQADRPNKAQSKNDRTAAETAKEWVKAYQTTERLSPRKRFAALFS